MIIGDIRLSSVKYDLVFGEIRRPLLNTVENNKIRWSPLEKIVG